MQFLYRNDVQNRNFCEKTNIREFFGPLKYSTIQGFDCNWTNILPISIKKTLKLCCDVRMVSDYVESLGTRERHLRYSEFLSRACVCQSRSEVKVTAPRVRVCAPPNKPWRTYESLLFHSLTRAQNRTPKAAPNLTPRCQPPKLSYRIIPLSLLVH